MTQRKNRPFVEVLESIKALDGTESVHSDIDWLIRHSLYTAPELQYQCWHRAAVLLSKELPDHSEAQRVFNGDPL